MIKEIIVVEGKDDTVAIKRAVEAETIETGGSAINKEVLERIRLAQERRGVIIFTDLIMQGRGYVKSSPRKSPAASMRS